MNNRKLPMLTIIFVLVISFWMPGKWHNSLLRAAEPTEKLGLKKPRLQEIEPVLKKILPPATEFKESRYLCCKDCLVDYLGFYKGKKAGIICLFKIEGQWGPMMLMMGVNMDGEITHIELSYHTETPGCGSQVDRRPFMDQFKGKTLQDPIEIYKDLLEATDAVKGVDCITRATVSSRAIAKGVKEQLKTMAEYYLSGNEDAWR